MRLVRDRFIIQNRSRRSGLISGGGAALFAIACVASATAPAASARAGIPASGVEHVVVAGDSMWAIARAALPSRAPDQRIAAEVERIAALNAKRLPRGAGHLRPGQRLALPATVAKSSRVQASRITAANWGAGPVRAGVGFRRASGSERVREAQRLLGCAGYALRADGRFGVATRAAVARFQRASGLVADGIVGARTLRGLRRVCAASARVDRRTESADRRIPSSEPATRVVPTAGTLPAAPARSTPSVLANASGDSAPTGQLLLFAGCIAVLGLGALLAFPRGAVARVAVDGLIAEPALARSASLRPPEESSRRATAMAQQPPLDAGAHAARRKTRVLIAVAVTGLAGTVLLSILASPAVYRGPRAHVAIQTGTTLIVLSCALLVLGRVRRSGFSSELLLLAALVTLGLGELAYALLPAIFDATAGASFAWVSTAVRLASAALLAAAALLPTRRLESTVTAAWYVVALSAAAVAVAGAAILTTVPGSPSVDPERPRVVGDLLHYIAPLVCGALCAAAAAGFARRFRSTGDGLQFWLSLASLLSALAWANYLGFPSLYSEWLSVGDAFRIVAALALLAGISSEVMVYQRRLAAEAVAAERRRMARELHDGIAQDLAFIRSQSVQLAAAAPGDRRPERISAAAQRALDESRSAISLLIRPVDESLDVALRETAEEVVPWEGVDVEVEVGQRVDVAPDARAALIRITREAVANAVRHGEATAVRVSVERDDALHLRVSDNGVGFDLEEHSRRGAFGLTSMRERAEELGGRFQLASEPESGTVVEVLLP